MLQSILPPLVPGKNHTGPCCLSAQCVPVLSVRGFIFEGMEIAHCHHLPAQSLYAKPYGLEFSGNTPGVWLMARAENTQLPNIMLTDTPARRTIAI